VPYTNTLPQKKTEKQRKRQRDRDREREREGTDADIDRLTDAGTDAEADKNFLMMVHEKHSLDFQVRVELLFTKELPRCLFPMGTECLCDLVSRFLV
jgi:hypothetical protein